MVSYSGEIIVLQIFYSLYHLIGLMILNVQACLHVSARGHDKTFFVFHEIIFFLFSISSKALLSLHTQTS